ncbi:MAG: TIM barrel protein [Methanomicrobiales archaeon]
MTKKVRFGPAGNPIGFKGETIEVCDYIHELKLSSYEYQATYGVRISKSSAKQLKDNSKKNDILVSMHGPYYINLSSNKDDVIERSVDRLVKSAEISEAMGAYRTVFHPGFYTKYSPEEAMKKAKAAINEIQDQLQSKNIHKYNLAPETTGKKSQLGSLDEIIEICQAFENFQPTIDFAHIHARNNGCIRNINDYEKIFKKLEEELDPDILHCHFTKIEYTDAGEKKHHTLKEDDYGPPVEPLLKLIIECGWNVTIICESPLLEIDAALIKEKYYKILKNKS